MKRFSELSEWPVFDEPYIVDQGVMEPFIETIAKGATDDAFLTRDEVPSMIVTEEEWNEDHTKRRVLKIRAYCPK